MLKPRIAALVVVLGLGVAGGAAAAATTSAFAPAAHVTVLHALAGLSFIAVGAGAATQRTGARVGALMCLVGFAWFIPDLGYLSSSAAVTIAVLEGTLVYGFLAHLFIAFPSGRVRGSVDRAVVGIVYAWTVLSNLVPDSLFAQAELPAGFPQNLIVLHRDPGAHTLAVNVHQILNMVVALVVFAFVVDHWARSTPLGRRTLAPLVWAAGPVELAIICLNVVGVISQLDSLRTITPTLTPLALMTLPAGFLAGLLRAHMGHASIGDLIVELGSAGPLELRHALASALRDPSLELAYLRGDEEGWIDVAGHAVDLPQPGGARATTFIARGGITGVALVHDPTLLHDPWLLQTAVAATALALDNERLRADVAAQLDQVRASRARIVTAQDEARRRIERDLHDGAQQRLLAVLLTISLARQRAGDAQLQAMLEEAEAGQRAALAELRRLAAGIHPAILTDGGLGPALRALALLSSVPVTLDGCPEDRLPAPVEAAAYFVVSEALANVGKHSGAGHAAVRIQHDDGVIRVEVVDDGCGGASLDGGSGLRGLADRVAALDGRMELDSRPAEGTRVRAEIPCA
ncbi:MAG TPA: sensor histidine kinase [Candidatus Dormibacteraeota bacterium]|nr:sensor histidine kinase [Candidatus Dormibacteraeota bacterium]